MRKRNAWTRDAVACQKKVLSQLVHAAKETQFGKDHNFNAIKNYRSFKAEVPVRDYEALRPYIEQVIGGKPNVSWKGKALYLSKTSGTTSGAKYIPISKESMPFHIRSAKHALLSYIDETKKASFVDGKMIFLQGSPALEKKNGLNVGRLSGIVAHHVPAYLQKNRMPSLATNIIEDWETKVDKIVEETMNQDLRLISGIPSWVQMYFERLLEATGKQTVLDVFPNFSLFVYGGVNYQPYRAHFESLIGKSIPSIELYPASEGFIAYQDSQFEEGMLLEVNSGIYYEFIPLSELDSKAPIRLSLEEIELGENYALVLNSNAGLWGYLIGDTVKFVHKDPYRIIVSGRIKHFTSAFGEHVIAEEVEKAMRNVCSNLDVQIKEFHVAPQTNPVTGLPHHQWFIEFEKVPSNMQEFRDQIDEHMQKQNIYYSDLIQGKVLQKLKVAEVQKGGFLAFMKSRGKLGGQNKIPRLSNDRKFAELLEKFLA